MLIKSLGSKEQLKHKMIYSRKTQFRVKLFQKYTVYDIGYMQMIVYLHGRDN